eukprot:jgi/Mesvir1/15234/Mv26315-RA.1
MRFRGTQKVRKPRSYQQGIEHRTFGMISRLCESPDPKASHLTFRNSPTAKNLFTGEGCQYVRYC